MTLLDNNILSLVIWLPILGAIVVLATGGDKNAPLAKKLALGFSLAEFVVSIPLFTRFDRTTSSMQFVEQSEWVPGFGLSIFLVSMEFPCHSSFSLRF